MTIRSLWHKHPGLRSDDQFTVGERAGWMIGNGDHGFDKYPFILLNLILSCLAAMQGSILLIAAKRADQISSELALHDYQTNVEADQVIHAVHEMTK